MGNPDKRNAAESATPAPIPHDIKIDDPPPPYTPYKTSADPKPPPLPSVPPVLTQEPLPATRPRIVRGPSPRITDDGNCQSCESCKAICCLALCWSWTTCVGCIEGCIQMCPETKPRQNQ